MANSHTIEKARAVKPAAMRAFASLAPVVGVGIRKVRGGYGVKVNLAVHPGPEVSIPKSVDGVPVWVEVVGKIRKRG